TGTDANLVDVAAVVQLPSHQPQRQHSIDDGQIERAVDVVVAARLGGLRSFQRYVAAEIVQIGRLGDEADGAAHGTRAVQSALRTAQDLDVIHVVQADIGLEAAAVVAIRAADHRLAVIDAGGRVAGGVDAADDILLVARAQILNRQAGNLAGDAHDPG